MRDSHAIFTSDQSSFTASLEDRSVPVLTSEDIINTNAVVPKARILVIGEIRAVVLAANEVIQGTQPVRSAFASTSADCLNWQDTIVESLSDELVRGIRGVVAVGALRVDCAVVRVGDWVG